MYGAGVGMSATGSAPATLEVEASASTTTATTTMTTTSVHSNLTWTGRSVQSTTTTTPTGGVTNSSRQAPLTSTSATTMSMSTSMTSALTNMLWPATKHGPTSSSSTSNSVANAASSSVTSQPESTDFTAKLLQFVGLPTNLAGQLAPQKFEQKRRVRQKPLNMLNIPSAGGAHPQGWNQSQVKSTVSNAVVIPKPGAPLPANLVDDLPGILSNDQGDADTDRHIHGSSTLFNSMHHKDTNSAPSSVSKVITSTTASTTSIVSTSSMKRMSLRDYKSREEANRSSNITQSHITHDSACASNDSSDANKDVIQSASNATEKSTVNLCKDVKVDKDGFKIPNTSNIPMHDDDSAKVSSDELDTSLEELVIDESAAAHNATGPNVDGDNQSSEEQYQKKSKEDINEISNDLDELYENLTTDGTLLMDRKMRRKLKKLLRRQKRREKRASLSEERASSGEQTNKHPDEVKHDRHCATDEEDVDYSKSPDENVEKNSSKDNFKFKSLKHKHLVRKYRQREQEEDKRQKRRSGREPLSEGELSEDNSGDDVDEDNKNTQSDTTSHQNTSKERKSESMSSQHSLSDFSDSDGIEEIPHSPNDLQITFTVQFITNMPVAKRNTTLKKTIAERSGGFRGMELGDPIINAVIRNKSKIKASDNSPVLQEKPKSPDVIEIFDSESFLEIDESLDKTELSEEEGLVSDTGEEESDHKRHQRSRQKHKKHGRRKRLTNHRDRRSRSRSRSLSPFKSSEERKQKRSRSRSPEKIHARHRRRHRRSRSRSKSRSRSPRKQGDKGHYENKHTRSSSHSPSRGPRNQHGRHKRRHSRSRSCSRSPHKEATEKREKRHAGRNPQVPTRSSIHSQKEMKEQHKVISHVRSPQSRSRSRSRTPTAAVDDSNELPVKEKSVPTVDADCIFEDYNMEISSGGGETPPLTIATEGSDNVATGGSPDDEDADVSKQLEEAMERLKKMEQDVSRRQKMIEELESKASEDESKKVEPSKKADKSTADDNDMDQQLLDAVQRLQKMEENYTRRQTMLNHIRKSMLDAEKELEVDVVEDEGKSADEKVESDDDTKTSTDVIVVSSSSSSVAKSLSQQPTSVPPPRTAISTKPPKSSVTSTSAQSVPSTSGARKKSRWDIKKDSLSSAPSLPTTGAPNKTATPVRPTGAPKQTATVVRPAGAPNKMATPIRPTGAQNQTATLVRPTGALNKTATPVRPKGAPNQTATVVRPTGSPNKMATPVRPTGAPNKTATVVRPTGTPNKTVTPIRPTGAPNKAPNKSPTPVRPTGTQNEMAAPGKRIPSILDVPVHSSPQRPPWNENRSPHPPQVPMGLQPMRPPDQGPLMRPPPDQFAMPFSFPQNVRPPVPTACVRPINPDHQVVWLVGSSVLCQAARYVAQGPVGLSLMLNQAELVWHGHDNLKWCEFGPLLTRLIGNSNPPDVLLVHMDALELATVSFQELAQQAVESLLEFDRRYPNCRIIWSETLPCCHYPGTIAQMTMEQVRINYNVMCSKLVLSLSGQVIKHSAIRPETPALFDVDKMHLSDLGNNIFLNNLRRGLAFLLSEPNTKIYCASDDRTF